MISLGLLATSVFSKEADRLRFVKYFPLLLTLGSILHVLLALTVLINRSMHYDDPTLEAEKEGH